MKTEEIYKGYKKGSESHTFRAEKKMTVCNQNRKEMKPQEAKTELEKRVLTLMKDSGYMLPEGYEPPGSLYALCRNVVKCCGPEPTDEEIEHEILLFYNT